MADSDDKDNVVRKVPVPKADLQVNFTTGLLGSLSTGYIRRSLPLLSSIRAKEMHDLVRWIMVYPLYTVE